STNIVADLLIAPKPTSSTVAPFAISNRAQPVAIARGGAAAGRASRSSAMSSVCCASGNATPRAIAIFSPSTFASELVPTHTVSGSGGDAGFQEGPAVITTLGAISVPVHSG